MRQSFIKTAAIAVFAAICGAVFSMSALAQTFEVSLDKENLQVTTKVLTGGGILLCCEVWQAEDAERAGSALVGGGTDKNVISPHFISGGTSGGAFIFSGVNAEAVYNLGAVLNTSFDYTKPFLYFNYRTAAGNTTPIRVAGIVSGAVVLGANGGAFSANISALMNFVGRTPISQELSYLWQTSTVAGEWDDIGTAQTYNVKGEDYVDGTAKTARLIVTDKGKLQDAQTLAVQFPAIVRPEGTLSIDFLGKEVSPYALDQVWFSELEISNGVSGGRIEHYGQRAQQDGVFTETGLNSRGRTSSNNGVAAFVDGNPLNVYLRYRAIYTDIVGIETEFFSSVVFIPQPTEGLTVDFNDVEINEAGAVLTANISGVSDENNNSFHTGGSFVSYTWFRQASDTASFVSITSGADALLYTMQAVDLENLVSGQKPVYRLVGSYMDALTYVQNVTAFATVNVQPPAPSAQTFQAMAILNKVSVHIIASVVSGPTDDSDTVCCVAFQANNAARVGAVVIDSLGDGLPSDHFLSGTFVRNDGSEAFEFANPGHVAVYNLGTVLNASYDYSKPFIYINFATFGQNQTPAIRVAGITGGSTTIDNNRQTLSINISGLRNVVGRVPLPQELTFLWQMQNNGTWGNVPGVTGQTYAPPPGATVRVMVTDKARMAAVETVTATIITAADFCNFDDRISSDGRCVACTGETPNREGNVCYPTKATCNDNSPPQGFASNACVTCTGETPVYGTTAGQCRATQQSDCTGTEMPILDNNACRVRRAADCAATGMILNESGSCELCTDPTPVRNGNVCQAAPVTEMSCNAAGERFDSGTTSCVACTGEMPNLVENTCRPTKATCNDNSPPQGFADNACITCTGNTPIYDTDDGQCTACASGTTFSTESNSCVPDTVTPPANTDAICNAKMQVLVGTSCMDCGTGTTFSTTTNDCVADTVTPTPPTAGECNANNQILVDEACQACGTGTTFSETTNACVADTVTPPVTPPVTTPDTTPDTTPPAKSSGGGRGAGLGFIAAAGLIFLVHGLSTPDTEELSFSPEYNYSFTESGYAYSAGGRVDYQLDNLRVFWTATQDNKDGAFDDFRYSSGAEYESDIWAASFSESVAGKVADYDFSFAAAIPGDDWKISSVYRLHSRFEEDDTTGWESESKNSLSLEGVLTLRGWELKPSAGFQWQNAEKFGETAKFGLDAAFNYKQWHITPAAAYQTNGDNTKLNLQITRRF